MVENKNNVELTSEQKKKYRWQYIKLMAFAFGYFTIFIIALLESIVQGLELKSFILFALALLFVKEIIETLLNTKEEIELIRERIDKRYSKNLKQGGNT